MQCPLTRQQLACLDGAARGRTEQETAAVLGIAPATVRNHLVRARQRLGAHNTTEAVARALVAGWLAVQFDADTPSARGAASGNFAA